MKAGHKILNDRPIEKENGQRSLENGQFKLEDHQMESWPLIFKRWPLTLESGRGKLKNGQEF